MHNTQNYYDMKRPFILFIAVICLACVACSNKDENIEYFPYRTEKSDFWGMMSPNGTPLFTGKFMFAPHTATRGVFMSREEDGKYAFYTAKENPQRINDEIYTIAKPFRFSDYTTVRKENDSHFSIIDIKGNHIASLPDSIIDIGLFSSGLTPFVVDAFPPRMGYMDTQGKIVIEARYRIATNYVCGVALVEEIIKGIPSLSIINPSGKKLYTFGNEWQPLASEYSDGLLPVINIRQEIGFLDTQGQLSIEPSDQWCMCIPSNPYTIPYTFKDGHSIYYDGEYYGLMNKRGKITAEAQYLNIYLGEGGLYAAENKDNKWGCIDNNGNVIIPFEHVPGEIRPSITPHAIIMQNGAQRYRIINNRGETISKPFSDYKYQ